MAIKRREIKTEKGIDQLIEVKYKFTKDIDQYEEALNYLEKIKKYHSIIAEKRRVYKLEKKVKLLLNPNQIDKYDENDNLIDTFLEEANKKFESLVKSYINFINPKYLNDEKYKKISFLKTEENNNINQILEYNPNKKLKVRYIIDDIIYIDSFDLIYKKFKGKIIIKKIIKTPFPLEYFSYKSIMAKWNFRRKFKYYVKDIENGLI